MLLSPRAIDAVSEVTTPADFYRGSHGLIYKAALDLYAAGKPVDAITLSDELERAASSTRSAAAPGSTSSRRSSRRPRTRATTPGSSATMAILRGLVRAGGEIAPARLRAGRREVPRGRRAAEQILFDLAQQAHDRHDFDHVGRVARRDAYDEMVELPSSGPT
jgi:replicative DNA helicase